ncbi:MAG: CoA-binding protein [Bacteroidetes bacterium]|nr:CoA-binding protein [Bacteroidota bacterium]MCZ6692334.1 CoA-binding protein [Bacteroidota bacterium]MCZ6899712.1 CoA-binding protein [Bacteroidota bacterium]
MFLETDPLSDAEIREIFEFKNIAVIGMSRHDYKAAHSIPKYLMEQGYNIIPVNPNVDEILGKKAFNTIEEVEEDIDVVEIFRPSEQVLPFVEQAIKKHPKVIWLQLGIHDPEAEELARKAGIKVVFNRCMYPEHQRLMS